jgi:hypothetical protein
VQWHWELSAMHAMNLHLERRAASNLAVVSLACLLTLSLSSTAQPAVGEITIKGMVLNNVHTGEKEKRVFLYALDGPAAMREREE